MYCGCESYECLETVLNFDNCRDEIELELPANETGTWQYTYEFNKRWFGGSVEVVNGENIVLPWTFNEDYIHAIKFFNSENELVNDTCYSLDTSKIAGSFTQSNNSDVGENVFNITVHTDGSTFSSSKINGRDVMLIADGAQTYNRQPLNFTQAGNTVTMTNGVVFYEGQIITVTIKH